MLPALPLVAGGKVAPAPDPCGAVAGALRLVVDATSHCSGQGLCRLWSGLCLCGAGLVAGRGGSAAHFQGSRGVGSGLGGDGDLDGWCSAWVGTASTCLPVRFIKRAENKF